MRSWWGRGAALAREREPDTYLPFLGHAAPGAVLLDDGSVLAVLALDGAPFEMADAAGLNARHAALNVLLRNVASDRIVLSSHLVRTLADPACYPEAPCRSAFARELDGAYRERLLGHRRLFRNSLFLSVLVRPAGSGPVAGGNVLRLFGRRRRGDTAREAVPA
ncbi:MAG: hypothetical protein K2X11_08035, partial [Acetobacteraceae bacterium]|nr:hypothetical protein [Acetobacteraceae bacterium]